MDSILVVCYSFTGTSHRAAALLCLQHGWPLGEIHDAQPRAGGPGMLRCVLDSLRRRHPAIRYQGPDPGDFRTVVLVAPVWAYRLAGPMRTFVAQRREALRRVAVLTTMDSGGASNAVAEIARILGHAPIQAAALTAREVLDGSCMPRLLAFSDALQPGSTATQPAFQPAWTAPRDEATGEGARA
jgi:hypothetical protein